jgi:methylenetetrahydrofolate--tRNA-(uracil-5-)-methyltransferase
MAQTILHGYADPLPNESCIASLMNRLVEENEDFQPMNFNFGLLPNHEGLKKKNKKEILAARAEEAVRKWIADRKLV